MMLYHNSLFPDPLSLEVALQSQNTFSKTITHYLFMTRYLSFAEEVMYCLKYLIDI